jgi:hypothetical protein
MRASSSLSPSLVSRAKTRYRHRDAGRSVLEVNLLLQMLGYSAEEIYRADLCLVHPTD